MIAGGLPSGDGGAWLFCVAVELPAGLTALMLDGRVYSKFGFDRIRAMLQEPITDSDVASGARTFDRGMESLSLVWSSPNACSVMERAEEDQCSRMWCSENY